MRCLQIHISVTLTLCLHLTHFHPLIIRVSSHIDVLATMSGITKQTLSTRPLGDLPRVQRRLFHPTLHRSTSPLFHLAALSASREGQFISKASGISRVDYSPNSQLLRAEAIGSTIPDEPAGRKGSEHVQDQKPKIDPHEPIFTKQKIAQRTPPQVKHLESKPWANISGGQERVSGTSNPAYEAGRVSRSPLKQPSRIQDQKSDGIKIPLPIILDPLIMDSHEKKYLIKILQKSLSMDQLQRLQCEPTKYEDEDEDAKRDDLCDAELQATLDGHALVNDREGLIQYLKNGLDIEQRNRGLWKGAVLATLSSTMFYLWWNHSIAVHIMPRGTPDNVSTAGGKKSQESQTNAKDVEEGFKHDIQKEPSRTWTSWFWSSQR